MSTTILGRCPFCSTRRGYALDTLKEDSIVFSDHPKRTGSVECHICGALGPATPPPLGGGLKKGHLFWNAEIMYEWSKVAKRVLDTVVR